VANEFPKLDVDEVNTEIAKRVSKEGKGLEVALKNKFAVVDQNSDAVFIGQIATAQVANKTIKVEVVAALTTISGRAFSLNLYKMYEAQPDFQELLVPLKAAIARTIAANP
jgi:hypothetical protein